MTALMIGLGALIGAPARYLTDRAVQRYNRTVFPWGTLTVNIVACLILGIATAGAGHLNPQILTLLGPGFCATLSTYSTFSYETVRLFEDGERFHAAAYVALSLTAGIGAATFGYTLGSVW